ncbi:MAG: 4-(cytidine 5'-diphospho)-2-C-methyl-D-erythritol kinase [Candidatus Lernaella stagnicola]|nr:4-(cytidine 5'-diphospho)-2-C-methyl-D-erythritol kinase [Candidatus Lernaella stagnicola]
MHQDAPAKINLRLEIVGRRADGYHLLRSIMVPISLADRLSLHLTKTRDIEFSCDSPNIPTDGTNLVVRAAKALQQAAGVDLGAKIHLEKRIPASAGLGGGSSDAAATLMGLRQLWKVEIDDARLSALALELGADVPFFLAESACLAEGVGERLNPYHVKAGIALALVKPERGLSTPEVYRALNWPLTQKVKLNKLPPSIGDQDAACALLRNDLEDPATRLMPQVSECKAFLREQGAVGVLMTGSGPTVFGIYNERKQAERACEVARQRNWWAFACDTA